MCRIETGERVSSAGSQVRSGWTTASLHGGHRPALCQYQGTVTTLYSLCLSIIISEPNSLTYFHILLFYLPSSFTFFSVLFLFFFKHMAAYSDCVGGRGVRSFWSRLSLVRYNSYQPMNSVTVSCLSYQVQ